MSSTASSTATLTVLFCDVVGSTERLVRIGDVAGDSLRRDLFAGLRHSVEAGGGIEVKNLGDGLMVVFPRSAIGALVCAREMHRAAAAIDPEDPIQLRIGISAGEVAEEDGDWFGLPVVEAARLCAAAAAEQTLAASLVRTLVGTRAEDHRIREIGMLQLKGLSAPLSVVEIEWRTDSRVLQPTSTAAVPAAGPTAPTVGPSSGGPPPSADSDAPDGPGRPRTPVDPAARARRGRRRTVVAVVIVLVAALLGLAISEFGGDGSEGVEADTTAPPSDVVTDPQGYEPELRDVACPEATSAAVPGAECSELIVPESRDDPGGRTVAVPVTKKAAATPSTAAPVVVVDVNEPLATSSFTEVSDVYSLSLRGFTAGVGPALECPELRAAVSETLAMRADDPAAIDRRGAAAGECAARLRAEGVQLEGFNMNEVADDLRDVVIAADLGRVTVAGGGFATPAIISFVRSNPGAANAMILTNAVPPGNSTLGDPAAALSTSLERLAKLCDADADCAAQHPDLPERYQERFEQLAATPAEVVTNSLVGTGPHTVLLDGRRWAAALEAVMWQSSRIGLVPEAIVSADNALIASAGIDEEVKAFVAPGARGAAILSYTCSYDAAPNLTAEISSSAYPEFAGANDASFRRMCDAWDVPSVYDELSRPMFGAIPTFLAQGMLSVAGANDWSGEMSEQLESSTVARFATMSEDLAYSPPPCLRNLRNEFAVDPLSLVRVESCEKDSPIIDFVGGTGT